MIDHFILVTLQGCLPCKAIKENLDSLTADMLFTYETIDASHAEDLCKQYDIQSAPSLIAPSGDILVGNPGRDRLKDFIRKHIEK